MLRHFRLVEATLADDEIGPETGDRRAEDDMPAGVLTCRRIIAGAAKLAEAGAVYDAAGCEPAVALFRRWVADRRAAEELYGEDEAAGEIALDDCDKLARAVGATPAAGAAGLAVKAFLAILWERGPAGRDCIAIDTVGREHLGCGRHAIQQGMLADAARLLPELQPFTAETLAAWRAAHGTGADRLAAD